MFRTEGWQGVSVGGRTRFQWAALVGFELDGRFQVVSGKMRWHLHHRAGSARPLTSSALGRMKQRAREFNAHGVLWVF